MAKSELRAPKDLAPGGRLLWRELMARYRFDSGETPALSELCRLQDRLDQVRAILRAEGLTVDGRRHPLADLEVKLSGQFRMLWRTLRLDLPPEGGKNGSK